METSVEEYPEREEVSTDWKTPILTALVTISLSVLGYFSLTVKTNTERIIKLESQQVTPQGLSTESGDLRKDLTKKIDQVSKKVDDLRTEVKTDIKNLRGEVDDLRTEVKTDIKDLRTELKTDNEKLEGQSSRPIMKNLRTELKTDIKKPENKGGCWLSKYP